MKNILFLTSEIYPLIKTGGLADYAYSLTKALKQNALCPIILVPGYSELLAKVTIEKQLFEFQHGGYATKILKSTLPSSQVTLWIVDCPSLFSLEGNPYCDINGNERSDSADRFAHFCYIATQCALDRIKQNWKPDVVHCNDWQTGLTAAYLSQIPTAPATVFTIHNLGYQGNFPHHYFDQLQIPHQWRDFKHLEFYQQLSFIKGGLVFADMLTTVSPSYAQEIQTSDFGWGMEGLLSHRSHRLQGILNGVDYQTWDPHADEAIPHRYDMDSIEVKAKNKVKLQKQLNLKQGKSYFLIAYIGRLSQQKGIEMLIHAMHHSAHDEKIQWVILASGNPDYEAELSALAQSRPDSVALNICYDETLAHKIEAAADCFLMPSYYEPCGLNQLYSLKYGTLPIVSQTGGLGDSVCDVQANTLENKQANGFVFSRGDYEQMMARIFSASKLFRSKKVWRQLQRNAMKQNFSWQQSMEQYLKVYRQAIVYKQPKLSSAKTNQQDQAVSLV